MKLIENFKRYFYVYIAMGLFLFFMWVSSMTPLVGDDWGYYINGLKGPLTMTFEFLSNLVRACGRRIFRFFTCFTS